MPRECYSPENAPAPGGPYSPVVRVGNHVWTAGQCGYRIDRSLVEGLEGQVRQAFKNLLEALAAAGANESDVVAVNVYLAAPDDFDAMNDVYREFFTQPFPVRTTVTAGLRPGVLFEIDAQAIVS
ncbi:MAG: RidA family protein [Pseudonocardiaceae bacterium]